VSYEQAWLLTSVRIEHVVCYWQFFFCNIYKSSLSLGFESRSCLSYLVEVKVEVNLRSTVSRSVWLGVELPSGVHDQIFVFSLTIKGFLDVRHPLWGEDGSVIYLHNCFWTSPEQSLLGRSPTELTTICSCLIWDSPNLEGQVPVFVSPGTGPVIPLGTEFSFVASYDSLRWRYSYLVAV
jgi:hypothetical protein